MYALPAVGCSKPWTFARFSLNQPFGATRAPYSGSSAAVMERAAARSAARPLRRGPRAARPRKGVGAVERVSPRAVDPQRGHVEERVLPDVRHVLHRDRPSAPQPLPRLAEQPGRGRQRARHVRQRPLQIGGLPGGAALPRHTEQALGLVLPLRTGQRRAHRAFDQDRLAAHSEVTVPLELYAPPHAATVTVLEAVG